MHIQKPDWIGTPRRLANGALSIDFSLPDDDTRYQLYMEQQDTYIIKSYRTIAGKQKPVLDIIDQFHNKKHPLLLSILEDPYVQMVLAEIKFDAKER